MVLNGVGNHGFLDKPEDAVRRIEHCGEFDFLAKWVRPGKVDGRDLPAGEFDGDE
jgi:hypothetical protein